MNTLYFTVLLTLLPYSWWPYFGIGLAFEMPGIHVNIQMHQQPLKLTLYFSPSPLYPPPPPSVPTSCFDRVAPVGTG